MTLTVYKVDRNRVFTGETVVLGPKDPISRDSVLTAPPEGEGFHIWDGHKWFTRQERPTPPPPPQPDRKVTVGEFFDLFGDLKYPILASSDPQVQALIQDITVRKFVDLKHPHLPQGLQLLISAGFPIDIDRILSGQPPEEGESDA